MPTLLPSFPEDSGWFPRGPARFASVSSLLAVPTFPPSHPTAQSGFTLPQAPSCLFQNLSAYNTRLFKEVGRTGS